MKDIKKKWADRGKRKKGGKKERRKERVAWDFQNGVRFRRGGGSPSLHSTSTIDFCHSWY